MLTYLPTTQIMSRGKTIIFSKSFIFDTYFKENLIATYCEFYIKYSTIKKYR